VVIPKELRNRLALVGCQELEIREREGRIELEPAGDPISLRNGADGPVADAAEALPPLTDDIVRESLLRTLRSPPSTPASSSRPSVHGTRGTVPPWNAFAAIHDCQLMWPSKRFRSSPAFRLLIEPLASWSPSSCARAFALLRSPCHRVATRG